MSSPEAWFTVLIYVVIGLVVFYSGWVFFVMIAALFGKTNLLSERAETPEARAERERTQAWLDKKVKAYGLGMAGSSWGLPLGAMVDALTKVHRRQNAIAAADTPPPSKPIEAEANGDPAQDSAGGRQLRN